MTEPREGKRSLLDQAGQATVEFALTLILLMAFILFYMQLSLVFAWGSYVQYATFMSARAMLSGGPTQEDQRERAKTVLARMVKRSAAVTGIDKFPSIAKGVGRGDLAGAQFDPPPQFNATNRDLSWMEGVRYTFRSKVFMIPLGRARTGGPAGTEVNAVTLTSESWLLRETSGEDCLTEMGKLGGIVDNGC